ncbi:MAG: efflux RND transporter periplasmic adaptor subunit [Deltaproteobacteria bacterium]|nr:efflux RND transporter periplasmic adaptor subunit [Deltaproteobacteria bacterium]
MAPLFLSLMLAPLASACGHAEGQVDVVLPQEPVPERTAHALRETLPRMRTLRATVAAVDPVRISAQTAGRVLRLGVDVGDRVERGQLLGVLESSSLASAVTSARSQLSLAESQATRAENLHSRGALPDAALDARRTQLTQAQAQLRAARSMLGYSRLRAPSEGVVQERLLSPGDLATPGAVVLTLYDEDKLWLEAQVPTQDITRVRLGSVVHYRVGDHEGEGTVAEVSPLQDPRSRTVRVRVRLEGADAYPGAFGTLTYETGEQERISVPNEAIVRVGQLTMVRVREEDGYHRRSVRLGERRDERVEVLAGLTGGEEVALP